MVDYSDMVLSGCSAADYAVRVEDSSLSPHVRRGQTVFVQRSCELSDGDIGIFYLDGNLSFFQFCEDHLGNVYLFSVNRRQREKDRMIPRAESSGIVCYGRLLLDSAISLPND